MTVVGVRRGCRAVHLDEIFEKAPIPDSSPATNENETRCRQAWNFEEELTQ
jgi:hypothetical protein